MPHWQSFLASELVLENKIVSFPSLPNRDFPKFDEWLSTLQKLLENFKPDVVVCHSLGCILWLYNPYPTKKLFLVAPPNPNSSIKELETFFPLNNFNTKASECYLITSDNDKYLNTEDASFLAKKLNVTRHIILENAGHINDKSGFGKWDKLKKMVTL